MSNSNREVTFSISKLSISRNCVLEKTLNAIIPTAIIKLSTIGLVSELSKASLCPWEGHFTPTLLQVCQSSTPHSVPI